MHLQSFRYFQLATRHRQASGVRRIVFPALVICLVAISHRDVSAAPVKSYQDLTYATIDGVELQLDISLPEGIDNPPLVVYIHGGGWRSGSRKKPIWFREPLIEAGYAVASIDYRLSMQATFPAQIHDCKGAIRWLRANAKQYGYDTSKIAVVGTSAGGHLALLMGTTCGDKQLEGTVGGNLDQSSNVSAEVDFYGPSDFLLRSKDQPEQTDREDGKVYMLLGGAVKKNVELAKLASPAWQVTSDDPPILAFQGTNDPKVLPNQCTRLEEACKKTGVPIEVVIVEGGGHGDGKTKKFSTPQNMKRILDFLEKHI